jgi:hypothetical protein
MPRLTKRRAGRRTAYNDHHIEALTSGCDWFRVFGENALTVPTRMRDDYTHGDQEADERRRQAWEDLRDDLMADWIESNPFTRPDGWWRYEAPERRQCLSGPHPHDDPAWPNNCPKWLSRGKPRFCAVVPGDYKAQYETQREYLERLGLLTNHERALLANENTLPTSGG